MIVNSNKELCLSYLRKYANKDIKGVGELFADDIILRDWKIRVIGKEIALKETRKNFETVDSIEIDVLSTYESEDSIAAELKITVDKTEELFVIDVITFNKDSKIASIRAYLGRGDN
ncbi:nuclear transport factor 2 family protein [Croceitalea rosinachiae]|uniref:Nuclear transport factor 2 family protein n=1 Tax=Croceitalea rosinachiae TaxID=3075596 RepID=A0ABU3ABY8_9FLAO|nr:nuclear transport factor 2 family protein [Croceitalea sp. F388]MDT0607701.1 nuclear transport factor 2 family protein [Croceitalea sp. F388]